MLRYTAPEIQLDEMLAQFVDRQVGPVAQCAGPLAQDLTFITPVDS